MLDKALLTAYKAHEKQLRKGTDIPYIVHPIEVAAILIENGASYEVIASGLLHDTVEDGDISINEIMEKFGENVARLVKAATEPEKLDHKRRSSLKKKESWRIRKEHTINFLKNEAEVDEKMVILADKLSNIRSLLLDFNRIENKVWKKFNAGPLEQKWYYESLTQCFSGLEEYQMFKEFKEKVKVLFTNPNIEYSC